MRSILVAFVSFICVPVFSQKPDKISTVDFTAALGAWKGKLTYLDYSSGKPYTMPANVTISVNAKAKGQIILVLIYPDEPKANGTDTLVISENGTELNGAKLVSKKITGEGSVQIITDEEGNDGNDNKKAVIRHIYTMNKNNFSNRKEVRFAGTDTWVLRNEYVFYR
jgi:hypothetical protein